MVERLHAQIGAAIKTVREGVDACVGVCFDPDRGTNVVADVIENVPIERTRIGEFDIGAGRRHAEIMTPFTGTGG